MGYIKLALEAFNNLMGWLNRRTDLANAPDMKAQKKAQQEQDLADQVERLTRTAMSAKDPKMRAEAIEELRRLDSE